MIGVRACVAVIEKGKVLLVPHYYPDNPAGWYLPGGNVEWLEPLVTAAKREFAEETGLELGPLTLLDVGESLHTDKHRRETRYSVTVIYSAQISGGNLRAETTPSAVYGDKTPHFFGPDELPEVAPYLRPAIARAFGLRR